MSPQRLIAVVSLVVALQGCTRCHYFCVAETNDDLARFATDPECFQVIVDDTALTNLDGLEGSTVVTTLSVQNNAALTSVAALSDLPRLVSAQITRNPALEVVSVGPLSGLLSLSNNGSVDSVHVELFDDEGGGLAFRGEPLASVVVTGRPGELSFSVESAPLEPFELDLGDAVIHDLALLQLPWVADADSLAMFGTPTGRIAIAGCAMDSQSDEVDAYFARLVDAGFGGELVVCDDVAGLRESEPTATAGCRRLP